MVDGISNGQVCEVTLQPKIFSVKGREKNANKKICWPKIKKITILINFCI